MPHDAYKALYIHIPFCRSKCNYCDFASEPIRQGSKGIDHYVEHLIGEIRKNSKEGEFSEIETVYFGGGTPTYIGSKHLTQLLYALNLSMNLTTDKEVTIEANPDSLDEGLVKDIYALGANRLSIGVQSFDDGFLQQLGRPHTADQAKRAIEIAQTRFDNVSLDLMCGLPGQSIEDFDRSLDEALRNGVKHVSIYPLTIEKGTKFEKLMRKGRLHIPDDDHVADMMELACDRLEGAGIRRYESANYAVPGYESRHNTSYWSHLPYIGIGHSAVTMTQNDERRMRTQDGVVIDDLSPIDMAAEDLMLSMRMTKGISDEELASYTTKLPQAPETFDRLADWGLIEHEEGRWRPTRKGWMLGNELFGEILDLAHLALND